MSITSVATFNAMNCVVDIQLFLHGTYASLPFLSAAMFFSRTRYFPNNNFQTLPISSLCLCKIGASCTHFVFMCVYVLFYTINIHSLFTKAIPGFSLYRIACVYLCLSNPGKFTVNRKQMVNRTTPCSGVSSLFLFWG